MASADQSTVPIADLVTIAVPVAAQPKCRLNAMGAMLATAMVCFLLPHAIWSTVGASAAVDVIAYPGFSSIPANVIIYFSGFLLLGSALARCVYARAAGSLFPKAAAQFVTGFGWFALVYLLDAFLSTSVTYRFARCAWPFFTLAPFPFVLLYLNQGQALRFIKVTAVLLGLRAALTVVMCLLYWYHATILADGNPLSGTFDDLSAQYSMYLPGATLCIALAIAGPTRAARLLFYLGAAANLLALTITQLTLGWVSIIVGLVYVLISHRLHLISNYSALRIGGIIVTAGLVAGLLLMLPNATSVEISQGQSAARSAVYWQSTLTAISRQPVLGAGLGSYEDLQKADVASDAASFRPGRSQPNSLYLSLLTDFGLVGLGVFVALCWRYIRLVREAEKAGAMSQNVGKIVAGVNAGLLAVLAAGLFDVPILQQDRAPVTFVASVLLGCVIVMVRAGLPPPAPQVRWSPAQRTRLRRVLQLSFFATGTGAACVCLSTALLVRSALPRVHSTIARQNRATSVAAAIIPDTMPDAVVAAEDFHFYEHHGIDWEAIHRSVRRDIRSLRFAQGGSTITMQMVRYRFLSEQKNLPRKLAELYLADYIERRLTKKQILGLYLSTVDFGMHTPGVVRAARTFFDKAPNQLTLGESAFLAVSIPKPPDRSANAMTAQVEAARRKLLLRIGQYYSYRYSDTQIQNAMQEPLVFAWEKREGIRVMP